MDQQLIKYIQEARAVSMSDPEIHRELLKGGWPEADIAAILNGGTQQPPKKLFKAKPVIIATLVIVALGGIGFWYRGFFSVGTKSSEGTASLSPQQSLIASPAQSATITPQPGFSKSLHHKLSLAELGITPPQVDGNAADLYVKIASTQDSKGLWDAKYVNKQLPDITLDDENEGWLASMASQKYFSIFPEEYPIPPSPLKMSEIKLVSMIPARTLANLTIASAKQMETSGDTGGASMSLQTVLVFGRLLQEDPFNTDLQMLTSLTIEKNASQELLKFYETRGNQAEAQAFTKYLDEIASMQQQMKGWATDSAKLSVAAVKLFTLSQDHPNPSRDMVRDAYAKLSNPDDEIQTYEQDFQALLASCKNLDEQVMQTNAILPLTIITYAQGIEPERSLAELALKAFAQADNQYVRQLAESGLKATPDEIKQWMARMSQSNQ